MSPPSTIDTFDIIMARASLQLESVKTLIARGAAHKSENGKLIETNGCATEILYSNGYQIARGKWSKENDTFPLHTHVGIEYLIVVVGEIVVSIGETVNRVMRVGECASIPPFTLHSVQSRTDDAEVVAVLIPPDETYQEVYQCQTK